MSLSTTGWAQKKYSLGLDIPITAWFGDFEFTPNAGFAPRFEARATDQLSVFARLIIARLNTPAGTSLIIGREGAPPYASTSWTQVGLETGVKYFFTPNKVGQDNWYILGELMTGNVYGTIDNSVNTLGLGGGLGMQYRFTEQVSMDFGLNSRYVFYLSGRIRGENVRFSNTATSFIVGGIVGGAFHF
jgi:hypothetical protein